MGFSASQAPCSACISRMTGWSFSQMTGLFDRISPQDAHEVGFAGAEGAVDVVAVAGFVPAHRGHDAVHQPAQLFGHGVGDDVVVDVVTQLVGRIEGVDLDDAARDGLGQVEQVADVLWLGHEVPHCCVLRIACRLEQDVQDTRVCSVSQAMLPSSSRSYHPADPVLLTTADLEMERIVLCPSVVFTIRCGVLSVSKGSVHDQKNVSCSPSLLFRPSRFNFGSPKPGGRSPAAASRKAWQKHLSRMPHM